MELFLWMSFKWNKAFVYAVIAFISIVGAQAQSVTTLRGNIEFLHSTHGNNFSGLSASYNKEFGKKWELGAGIEYAHTPTHNDNGWNLYHLHFVPVYVSEYYKLGAGRTWAPYIHLQQGITYSSYYKEYQDNPGPRYHIKEFGFYGAAGLGTNYYLSPRSGFFAEFGMKGFHLSSNNLDVNPHGITGKLGYVYRLKQ
ncbi:MAG: outer membrane beta-barrel protein [Niabella sp.]|nr:outer membrane beta-barrel protein [Niabella sp.]